MTYPTYYRKRLKVRKPLGLIRIMTIAGLCAMSWSYGAWSQPVAVQESHVEVWHLHKTCVPTTRQAEYAKMSNADLKLLTAAIPVRALGK